MQRIEICTSTGSSFVSNPAAVINSILEASNQSDFFLLGQIDPYAPTFYFTQDVNALIEELSLIEAERKSEFLSLLIDLKKEITEVLIVPISVEA